MRILMVSRVLYPRSLSESVMFRLADTLTAMGHEVFWFSREDRRNRKQPGAYLQPVPDFSGVSGRKLHEWQLWDPSSAAGMNDFLQTHQPDAALLFHVADSLTWSVLEPLHRAGVPCFQMALDFDRLCPAGIALARDKWWKPASAENLRPCLDCVEKGTVRCALRRCVRGKRVLSRLAAQREQNLRKRAAPLINGWLVPSEWYAKQLRRMLPGASVEAVELPLPLAAFQKQETDRGRYFLYAGALTRMNGIWQLLDAIAEVSDPELRVVFAGDGPEREALLAMVEKRKLQDRFLFLGTPKVRALTSAMAGCEALIVPSLRYEIGPSVMLEALAMGKPVIAARQESLADRIMDGFNGWLYPPEDTWALVRCMDQAADMPQDEYDTVCRQAAQDARDRYHPEAYARRILSVIGG